MPTHNTAEVINLSAWTTQRVRAPRLPHKFSAIIEKVRPLFAGWMKADAAFESNTKVVAVAIAEAFELFTKENPKGTRVDFARHFDSSIAEDAKTRDLADNAAYNRLNYLLDKVSKPAEHQPGDPSEPTVTIKERRQKMHADYISFRRRHKSKAITMAEVDELLKSMLAEIWNEEAIKEVVAA